MSVRSDILRRLAGSKNLAVERVVELALLSGGAERKVKEQEELAGVLISRNKRAGRVALVKSYDRLGEEVRGKLLGESRELYGALSDAMTDSEGAARVNVIEIVRQSEDPRLAYLLAEALIDARAEVRELAGRSLLEMVKKHREREVNGEEGSHDAEDAVQLRRAVTYALKLYRTHKQAAALLAALIFERQQVSPMWSSFDEPRDEVTRAAGGMLRNPPVDAGAGLATAMVLALGSSLKPAAIGGLSSTEDPEVGRALVRESFRLIDPILREAAQGVGQIKALGVLWTRSPADVTNWGQWLMLVEALGMPAAERIMWLGRLLEKAMSEGGGRAPAWKLSVMRVIAAESSAEAGRLLARLLTDEDERVARGAARHLLSKHHPEWRGLAGCVVSPHASVRRMVGIANGSVSSRGAAIAEMLSGAAAVANSVETEEGEPRFEDVWSEYSNMPPAVQHTMARVTSSSDPQFAELLRARLSSAQTQEVAQGLRMVSALANITPYRAQIIMLCGHADVRVAAIAVKMISRLEDPRLKDLLEAAAQHTDPRVRANAVESMAALHIADRSAQVLAMLNSRFNRERANAIKAISEFNFETARECLSRMLVDPNPLHRISALWVVGQLELPAMFRAVSSMARRDPNVRVRRRAAEMVEALTGQSNTVPG